MTLHIFLQTGKRKVPRKTIDVAFIDQVHNVTAFMSSRRVNIKDKSVSNNPGATLVAFR